MTVNLPAFTSNPPQINHQKTTFCTPFLPKPPAKTGKPASKKNIATAFRFSHAQFLTLASGRRSEEAVADEGVEVRIAPVGEMGGAGDGVFKVLLILW